MADSIEEFFEEFSGAPYELHEFAEGALEIEDCAELVESAQAYLDAREAFKNMLEEHGVEQG